METIKEFEERTGIEISINKELNPCSEEYFVSGRRNGICVGSIIYASYLELVDLSLAEFIQLYSLPEIENSIKQREKEKNDWNERLLKFTEITGIAATTCYERPSNRLCIRWVTPIKNSTDTISRNIQLFPMDFIRFKTLSQDEFVSFILDKLRKS